MLKLWLIGLIAVTGVAHAQKYWEYKSVELNSDEHGVHSKPVTRTTTCACGWANKGRIVGGKETRQNEYPLMAALYSKAQRFVFCGGSIITSKHILTAAHCTQPAKGAALAVIVGAHDITKVDRSSLYDVDYTIEHENYNNRNFDNDIAIMVLKDNIKFNQFVGPVCLPNVIENHVDSFIKVLGWGKLVHRGAASRVLMKVDLKVLPLQDCVSRHNLFIDQRQPRQICTFRRNKDSCQGDSGGPLIKHDPETNRFTQVALVSYGLDCASMDPAVNTDVAYHMGWIRSKIAQSGGQQVCTKI